MTQLTSLAPGTRAQLVSITGKGGYRRRLLEMGLLPGTWIRVVRQAGIGNLVELEVRGCYLSLRRSEASELVVDENTAEARSTVGAGPVEGTRGPMQGDEDPSGSRAGARSATGH